MKKMEETEKKDSYKNETKTKEKENKRKWKR